MLAAIMHLPSLEACGNDPFLLQLRETDKKQFLSTKWGSNQKFESQRRILLAALLMKKYLPKQRQELAIADFACGTGNLGLLLAEDNFQVDLVDNEKKFFDYISLKTDCKNINFIHSDIAQFDSSKKYHGIFLGEAIEHMAEPLKALQSIQKNLLTGGILCLSTPNGDFVDCYEPNWEIVKNQTERNQKIANTLGNHVCEFTMKELKNLVKEAGFCVHEHTPIVSAIISKSNIIRRLPSISFIHYLDKILSKKQTQDQKLWGKLQILVAQKI